MRRDDIIRGEIARRGIRHLIHFTQVQNLPGIVSHGILPRRELIERGIRAQGSDAGRLDREDGAISVSVGTYYPKMFEAKRFRHPGTSWVLLALDPSILWRLECRFFDSSAASRDHAYRQGSFGGARAFLRMFEDRSPYDPSQKAYRAALGIPDSFPTRPDAEVQVLQAIAPECILAAAVDDPGIAHAVQAELDGIQGPERDVVITRFEPSCEAGILRWG